MEVSRKLKEAYRDEEDYWEQKSRTNWRTCRDRNTKNFHALTKQRRIHNMIIGLYNEQGNWVNSKDGVESVAIQYFQDFFRSFSPSNFDGFLEEVLNLVTEDQNGGLMARASEEEVRKVFS